MPRATPNPPAIVPFPSPARCWSTTIVQWSHSLRVAELVETIEFSHEPRDGFDPIDGFPGVYVRTAITTGRASATSPRTDAR